MPLKKYKPTSPGRRFMSVSAFDDLTKGKKAEKSLLVSLKTDAGRNAQGKSTARHQGVPHYADGEKCSILAPVGLTVGDKVVSGPESDIRPGNALPLSDIPLGSTVHNIELKPGRGGQVVRSAGMSAQLLAREGDYAQIRMPSGEVRRIAVVCYATIGQIGNVEHENENVGKAGKSRWRGKRPSVRGMAMNPFDHPHGGGEGRSGGGVHPQTPWGKPTLGYRTRRNKKTKNMIVRRRPPKRKSKG